MAKLFEKNNSMKKTILFLFAITLLGSCGSDSFNNNNPYLPNYNFSIEINTDLPSYNSLKFASNSIKVFQANAPSNGIIIFNTGNSYTAFDGSCPNQAMASCSRLTLNGITATCPCQSEQYNLFTGQAPNKEHQLKPYRIEVNGSILRIYN